MREYLFRGKRKYSDEWVYGDLIQGSSGSKFILPIEAYNVTYYFEVIPETVGQYTGLNDKNGKKIYEGDNLRGFQKKQDDKEGNNGFEVTDTVRCRPGGFMVFGKNMTSGYTRDGNVLSQFMWCIEGHYATKSSYYQIDDIEVIGSI